MDSKLTLTIEETLINKAKSYAKTRGRSLSDIVENYFKVLTTPDDYQEIELGSVAKNLKGSFKVPDDFDYKKVLQEEISKRHL